MKKKAGETKKQSDSGKQDVDNLIWGINTVYEALARNPGGLSEVLVVRGKAGPKCQEIIDQTRSNKVKLRFVEEGRLGVPRHVKHQGVVARQASAQLLRYEELIQGLEVASKTPYPRILALDSIQDPRNLGAIFRSALAAGFSSVILTRERSAPLTGTVARTSAGAINQLRICQVVNLTETLKDLKQRGYWIFGTVSEQSAMSLYDVDFSLPICLVIGSEGKGIRPLVKKNCDHLVTIPMQGEFNSLNASVAAAIAMFEIDRQQR